MRPHTYLMPTLARTACWAALIFIATAPSAWSQPGGDPGQTSANLQEIIVTAQRRVQNLQDVPVSVEAFDQKALVQAGINTISELALRTPGVDVSNNIPGNAEITVRGVAPIGGLPTTAVYIDDVPITGIINPFYTGSPNPLLLDVARVEVLKGPQGTLYGDSALGGAIKFISNQPNPTALSGSFNIEGDSTQDAAGSYEASGTANAPIVSDKLAIRASADYRLDGGYIDNVSPVTRKIDGDNVNVYKTAIAKVALGITPDDSLTIIPEVMFQRTSGADRSFSTASVPPAGPAPASFDTGFLSPLEKETYQPEPSVDHMTLASLRIIKHFGGMDLTAISGYFDRTNYEATDATAYVLGALQGTPLYPAFSPSLTTSYTTETTRTISQEIRLSSPDSQAPFKWTAGLFFSNNKYGFYQPVITAGLTNNLAAELGPGITLQTLVPYALPNDDVYLGNSTATTAEYAAYGEMSYDVTRRLTVTLGARAFSLRQNSERLAEGFFNGGTTSDNQPTSTFNGVEPRAIASYKITPHNMVYASASEGFRPGVLNSAIPVSRCAADLAAIGRSDVPAGARPDSLWNYEVGSKNSFWSDRLRLNAAAYQMNWQNMQLEVVLPTCGFNFTANVGTARIRGSEFSVDALLAPGVTAGIHATYLDAVVTSAVADVEYRGGDELPNTPKQWYTAYAEWQGFYTSHTSGYVRVEYYLRGNAVRDPSIESDLPNYQYGGWSVTNINVGIERQSVNLRLFVNNVFNKRSDIDYQDIWGLWRTSTLRPRTFGLNVGVAY